MTEYSSQHLKEFEASAIDLDSARLNIEYLSGDRAVGALLWGIGAAERTNTGRVRDKYLKRYQYFSLHSAG
jgi:hypothetical protein